MQLLAPAKLNLCLYLGARRSDGLHRLGSLFLPLGLADRLEVEAGRRSGDAGRDEIGPDRVTVEGGAGLELKLEPEPENLVSRALRAAREADWQSPPLDVRLEKRIPVGAGLGGGSADAAAILRWIAAGRGGERLDVDALAMRLGADVPSQIRPRFSLVGGAGELVEPLPDPAAHAVLLLPDGGGLNTAEVFAEADRLDLGRDDAELDRIEAELRAVAGTGAAPLEYADLLVNDLEPAAISLRPSIADSLAAVREAGAPFAAMTGAGSTVFGLFPDLDSAHWAAARLAGAGAIVCSAPVKLDSREEQDRLFSGGSEAGPPQLSTVMAPAPLLTG